MKGSSIAYAHGVDRGATDQTLGAIQNVLSHWRTRTVRLGATVCQQDKKGVECKWHGFLTPALATGVPATVYAALASFG